MEKIINDNLNYSEFNGNSVRDSSILMWGDNDGNGSIL